MEWNRLKDKEPPYDCSLLVFSPKYGYQTDLYATRGMFNAHFNCPDVTHWMKFQYLPESEQRMPLPEPPKE